MFRELAEETGLNPRDVAIIGCTRRWLCYRLPDHLIRKKCRPVCIGQKQLWFLLRLIHDNAQVQLNAGNRPEFDRWKWVDCWHPLKEVVPFKRLVYREALTELIPLLFPDRCQSATSPKRNVTFVRHALVYPAGTYCPLAHRGLSGKEKTHSGLHFASSHPTTQNHAVVGF